MWRAATLAILISFMAGLAHAAAIGSWEACPSKPGPGQAGCQPVKGRIDPQGRELWLRAPITGDAPARPALYIAGATSSEAWLNGARIGGNGQPGASAATERPGRYQAAFPFERRLWRNAGNELVLHLSAFHAGVRFDYPIGGIWIGEYPRHPPQLLLAATFAAAGALLAGAFGFGAVFVIRRTSSSLMLAMMAALAALQALVENVRHIVAYAYPLHAWRVGAIWVLAAAFAFLLIAFMSGRFSRKRRRLILGVALVAIPATVFAPGFDGKAGSALMLGVALSGVAAGFGVRDGSPGARLALAYLAAFLAVTLAAPEWLLDLSFFMLAASLILPLLILEVVRLGRDDRDREIALTRAASRPDRLTVATAKGVVLTPLSDIVAIVGADDYAELRLKGGRSLLHAARLERLQAQLPPSFLRVHRSAIANLAHVEKLEREGGRWRLHMDEGPPLPVSRARHQALRDALDLPPVTVLATG